MRFQPVLLFLAAVSAMPSSPNPDVDATDAELEAALNYVPTDAELQALESAPADAELEGFDFATPPEQPEFTAPEFTAPEFTPSNSTDEFQAAGGIHDYPLVCTPSPHYSLWVTEIHAAANKMIKDFGKNQLCAHIFDAGPRNPPCTIWGTGKGEVRLQVCADKRGPNVKCHSVAWAAKHIANNCRNPQDTRKAQGYYFFDKAKVFIKVGNY